MGINQPYPILFQNVEYRFASISLCPKLNMVTLVLGHGLKKGIQGFGHLFRLNPFLLGLIFLCEDKSPQVWTQNLHSRVVKLVCEDFRIQISFIFNKFSTLPESFRRNLLIVETLSR